MYSLLSLHDYWSEECYEEYTSFKLLFPWFLTEMDYSIELWARINPSFLRGFVREVYPKNRTVIKRGINTKN